VEGAGNEIDREAASGGGPEAMLVEDGAEDAQVAEEVLPGPLPGGEAVPLGAGGAAVLPVFVADAVHGQLEVVGLLAEDRGALLEPGPEAVAVAPGGTGGRAARLAGTDVARVPLAEDHRRGRANSKATADLGNGAVVVGAEQALDAGTVRTAFGIGAPALAPADIIDYQLHSSRQDTLDHGITSFILLTGRVEAPHYGLLIVALSSGRLPRSPAGCGGPRQSRNGH